MPERSSIDQGKLQVWMPFLLSLMVVFGMFVGYKMAGSPGGSLVEKLDSKDELNPGRIEEVIRYVESKYVDNLNSDALIEDALKSILSKLDPHSVYLTPEMLQRTNEEMAGSFTGLGIESFMIDDTLNIFKVMENSPADEVGLVPGDRIIYVEDSLIANQGLEFSQIRNLIKKEEGEEIRLKIQSVESAELVEKLVTSGKVDLHTSDVAYMINDKIGYIQIKRFSSTTYKEFMLELEEMVENQNLENLIVDVRNNPGGYLPQATDILSQLFSRKGNLLVYTEGRNGRMTEYKTTGKSFFDVAKIAVLVDGGSASGSEILAGAIQDWDRGVIVGRRTFGKGLVQEQYNLKNGAALRLTIARYYTPSGRLIQKPYDNLDNYNAEHSDRIGSGELFNADKMTVNDSTQYYTLKDRRVVYGGGGIMPDVFVAIDSTELQSEFQNIVSYLQEFVYRSLRNGTLTKENWNNLGFDGLNSVYEDFKSFSLKQDENINSRLFDDWNDKLMVKLRSRIAYQFEGEETMTKILNEADKDVIAALKALKS